MRARMSSFCALLLPALALLLIPTPADAGRRRGNPPHEAIGRQTWASPQVNPIALSPDGTLLAVANTTSNTVDFIDTASNLNLGGVEVGMEPSALAFKPNGTEVWVSNHVSDSVSVISTVYFAVVATVQDVDSNGVSQFDEPTGIAFADDSKAYVALSSRNDIAIVDTATYSVTGRIHITGQDPRAITVRNGRLYVTAFESGNQSELSICPDDPINPPQCTMDQSDLGDFVLTSPNVPGSDTRIIIDPGVPDRDLFVFNTASDNPISGTDEVSGLGTLLYGIAVDSNNVVYITQTDARNDVNGLDGENLNVLDNRIFLNRISVVDCGGGGGCNSGSSVIALEAEPTLPAPSGSHPDPSPTCGSGPAPRTGCALATPYGIQISGDDSTIVATAMGTSRVFTVDTSSGLVLDTLDLGSGATAGQQIPRGVALHSTVGGAPQTAYVLNSLANSVTVVDVSNPSAMAAITEIPVGNDPTPTAVREGRIAFMNAFASNSSTFSCESCHPDGNTDQLLWRIGGACFFGACTGDDEVRSTMPVRGLKNTLPLHWDGTLGDPFGGTDGSLGGGGSNAPDCDLGGPEGDADCFRHLVDASLSGVMCNQFGCANGPSGLPGELSTTERDNMATFLASVSYPPARSRPSDDVLTASAVAGFSDFFVDRLGGFPDDLGDVAGVSTCADMNSGCHSLPLGVDHNSSTLAGFDVPTMRGMTDRFIHFSLGITSAEESLVFANSAGSINLQGFNAPFSANPFQWNPSNGMEEDTTFGAAFPIFEPVYDVGPVDMFEMFEEASTGHPGTLGRQVTIRQANACTSCALEDTLLELEAADAAGLINLRGTALLAGAKTLSWDAGAGLYRFKPGIAVRSHADLITDIQNGGGGVTLATLTGHLRGGISEATLQPLLAPNTTADGGGGINPDVPILPGDNPMTLQGQHVEASPTIIVDGQIVAGSVACNGGIFDPDCTTDEVIVTLTVNPSPNGLHLLQLQNPGGLLSNEMPICVGTIGDCQ